MGAFLLAKKPARVEPGQADQSVESTLDASLQVFAKKGMSLNRRVSAGDFILYTFNKNKFPSDNTLVFDDGQFIAATGTMIYNRKTGREALADRFQGRLALYRQ